MKKLILLTLTLVTILVSISAVSAANTINVGPTGDYQDIKNAVGNASDNDTIIIANGIYSGENNTNIEILKNLTIQGQSKTGTIIDAQREERIFTVLGNIKVILKDLTLRNANESAVANHEGNLIVQNCAFTNNNGEVGGAINSEGDKDKVSVTATGCTFTNNNADYGGAIYLCEGFLKLIGCTFTNNNATEGGAIYIDDYTNTTITGCTFTGNTAAFGGAISIPYDHDFLSDSYIGFKITDSTIKNNKAVEREIKNTADGSSYGGLGGGIYVDMNAVPYYSIEIIGNHILNNVGSGIYIQKSFIKKVKEDTVVANKLIINFNRIFGNTPYGIYYNQTLPPTQVSAAVDDESIFNAKLNWWGKNSGPNTAGADKTNLASTFYAPWIIMKFSPSAVNMVGGTTTTIVANFLYDNLGGYHNPANGHIPDGTPVLFTTTLGQVGSSSVLKYTVNGVATALLKAWDENGNPVSGIAYLTATTDAQTLSSSVTVEAATVGMQKTGLPIAGLILAVLALFGGLATSKRK